MSGYIEGRGSTRVLMDAIPWASETKEAREPLVPLEVPLDELVELANGRGFGSTEIIFQPGHRGVGITIPGENYTLCLFPFSESDGRETVWVMSSHIRLVRKAFYDQGGGGAVG